MFKKHEKSVFMIKKAFILNFFKLYNILWTLILPFLAKNNRLKHGFEKRISVSHLGPADIWIQAASAGEAYLAEHIIKTMTPDIRTRVLVTTLTTQGMDILSDNLNTGTIHQNIDLAIDWFPFDKPDIMEKAVNTIQPKIMVLLETEIWPALLWFLKLNQTKICIANARLSANSFSIYRKTRFLWKHLSPDTILAISKTDADRYGRLFKTTRIHTMSNIKFESLKQHQDQHLSKDHTRQQIKQLVDGPLPLTILASIRKQEEKIVLKMIGAVLNQYPDQVVAVFPRHMHRIKPWKKRLKSAGITFELKSQMTRPVSAPVVILWDTFGELKIAYEFARVVFVGASLVPLGGQNFLEPAQQGAATVTGPFYDDFQWANDAIAKEKIISCQDNWQGVKKFIVNTLKTPCDNTIRQSIKDRTSAYIQTRKGGTIQVCNEIFKSL